MAQVKHISPFKESLVVDYRRLYFGAIADIDESLQDEARRECIRRIELVVEWTLEEYERKTKRLRGDRPWWKWW